MRTIASRRQKTSDGRFVGRFSEKQLFRATLRTGWAVRPRRRAADRRRSYDNAI
jgi:hypothetical protein